jgi:hypothetical protein
MKNVGVGVSVSLPEPTGFALRPLRSPSGSHFALLFRTISVLYQMLTLLFEVPLSAAEVPAPAWPSACETE